ncbi:MAG: ABC transporter substrate-binding protein [Negativicutes bacterium]|nr:ABC transporter substrate-binding protein [Negativicutes bacterium]
MKKYFIILFALMLLTSACGFRGEKQTAKDKSGYTVTDDSGRLVYLKSKPTRIVSTTYGTDEILIELVEVKKIIALSRWAGDPEITFISKEQAAAVGQKVSLSAESILALKPDIVFVSITAGKEVAKTLEEMGVTVYVADSPKNYEAMKKKVLGVASAVGEKEKGAAMARKMDVKMAALNEKLKKITPDKEKKVMAFSFIGAIGRKGNLLDDIFRNAHVRNCAAEAGLKQESGPLSKEQIVAINPDVILLPTWDFNSDASTSDFAKELLNDPAIKDIAAIKNNKAVFVSDRYRYVASQHITDSIEAVAKAVYPELF